MEFAQPKKKRKPLPGYAILIIVFGSLSVVFGIARGIIQAQTEKTAAQVYDLLNGESSSSSLSSGSYVGVTPIVYNGLSMKIPKGWTYETSDEGGGLAHQVCIESPDVENSTITWGHSSNMLSPSEWIQSIHDTGGDSFPDFSPGEVSRTTYCGQDAYTFDCSMKKLGFTYYARFFTFEKNGQHFMVVNLSDFKSSLSSKFGFIENTLTVE